MSISPTASPRASAASATPTRPVVLAPLALTNLVDAGLRAILEPYQERVCLAPPDGRYDVGVVDPDLLGDDWRAPDGRPVVAMVRDQRVRTELRARELGLRAVVSIDLPAEELVASLESVHTGCGTADEHADPDGGPLTPREQEIIALICQGLSNQEVAERLFLSLNSIKSYIRTAYRKMGVSTRSQAVLWGLDRGYG